MKKLILVAALVSATAAQAQAQVHHPRKHHPHAAASYPDTVMLDGKEYKVCKGAMVDDCINPRQAGLGFGNRPTNTYDPAKADQHP